MKLEIRPVEKLNDRLNAELFIDHCFQCYVQLPATFPPGTYPLTLRHDKTDAAWVFHLADVPDFPNAAIAARNAPEALTIGRDLRDGELRRQPEALQALIRLLSNYILAGGLTITIGALPARIPVAAHGWPLPENPLVEAVDDTPSPAALGPNSWLDRYGARMFALEMFLFCEFSVWAWHILTQFRWRDWLQDAIICAVTFTLGYLSGQTDQK